MHPETVRPSRPTSGRVSKNSREMSVLYEFQNTSLLCRVKCNYKRFD